MEGNHLREARTEAGITQMELSLRTGIHPSDIGEVERGRRVAFPGWRSRIAVALNKAEEEIFPSAG